MTRLLVTIDGEPNSTWQGFTEVCQVFDLPYNTLKSKPWPRSHGNVTIYKLPFRAKKIDDMNEKELIQRLEACNQALERAAWCDEQITLDELDPCVVESTGVATSCLIEARENNKLIRKIKYDHSL